jgi:ribosomal protein S18 acetylase RimI-like enzyme
MCKKSMQVRNLKPEDHNNVIKVMPTWWGGRDLTASVPKILFIHFQNTSFVAESNGEMAGFLVGFFSQTYKNEAYIHFAGVNPNFRRQGVGKTLYKKFFEVCKNNSIDIVRSCTSPINKLSILFHKGMGFSIIPSDNLIEGVPVSISYLKENEPLVLFRIEI